MAEAVDGIPNLGVGQGKKRGGQPEAERKRVCIASAAQEKWTFGIFLLCVFQKAFIRLARLNFALGAELHVLFASRKEELSTLTGHGADLPSRCGVVQLFLCRSQTLAQFI